MKRHTLFLNLAVGIGMLSLILGCDREPMAPWGPTGSPDAADFVVVPSVAQLEIGGRVQLTAKMQGEDGAFKPDAVNWYTSNPDVAQVDDGLVRGIAPGTAYIYADYEGLRAQARVTVRTLDDPGEDEEDVGK